MKVMAVIKFNGTCHLYHTNTTIKRPLTASVLNVCHGPLVQIGNGALY